MIFYSDGPNISFVNSFYEKEILNKLPTEYALNLLVSDKSEKEAIKIKR